MGKDKLIEFLKKTTTEKWIKIGQERARNSPDNSFKTYVNTFQPPRYEAQLLHEVVVDTDTVFELKVKECLLSWVFRQADVGFSAMHTFVLVTKIAQQKASILR